MSKLLANQISNYNDNGPVEVKDGVNIPTGKPLQVDGGSGSSGQFLKSTGTSVEWETFPSIPNAQVNVDWNATAGLTQILNKPTLATVATSGSYSDLLNQPTIPAGQIQSDWNQIQVGSLDYIKNKPTIFSGSYSDLTGRPTIPSTITDLSGVNLPNPIPDGTYIQWDNATARWIAGTGSSGILDVVEDTTPQLGGTLDANGNTIDMGSNTITDALVGQWTSAYNWGDHSAQGYLKVYTNTTYSQSCIGDAVGVKLRLTDSVGTQDDLLLTAGTGISITSVSTEGFTINSTATGGGGGGATVTTDDNAPGSATDGDLWWKSDEGRLKVYYNDGSGTQWVDASPPLAPTQVTDGFSSVVAAVTNPGTVYANRFLQFTNHILPSATEQFDIGSADKKIRHLFLSDNSLWIGDDHKIDASGGVNKTKKRNKESLPKSVTDAGGTNQNAINHANNTFSYDPAKTQVKELTVNDLLSYLQIITSSFKTPNDLYPPEVLTNGVNNPDYTTDDWEEVVTSKMNGKSVAPITNAPAGVVDCDLKESNSFIITDPSDTIILNMLGASVNKEGTVLEFTVYVKYSATAYLIAGLNINGVAASLFRSSVTDVSLLDTNTVHTFTVKAVYIGGAWQATALVG
tara:strand:+ start:434 stop:2323 length:1890 start_codon:yes stop_codon:yes gene_type:complete